MALTRTHRANLGKLADYLESLPKNYRHFGMASYLEERADRDAVVNYARHNGGVNQCGTAACAVGHGPAAGVLFRPGEFDRFRDYRTGLCYLSPDWETYSKRFVPQEWAVEWLWAFSGDWNRRDNHHWGAAARIRYLLKHGAPPQDFEQPHRKWRAAYAEFDKRLAQGAPE